MNTILLIDGNNSAHKARHTFSLTGPDGSDVSVIFGFLNSLRYGLKRFKPRACIIAWDGRIPSYRREKVPSYKAHRTAKEDPTYPIFLEQMDRLQEILPLTGTVNVQKHGIEADDFLYHSAFLAKEKYDRIVIVSDDADLFQAVELDDVFVYSSRKDKVIDRSYIESNYGVKTDQYIPWRALQGDTSDNISGVMGIGPVRATKLFQKYETLPNILEAAFSGEIKGKMGYSILEFGEKCLSKNLDVMSLSLDRTGSRRIILEEVAEYQKADLKTFKKSLFSLRTSKHLQNQSLKQKYELQLYAIEGSQYYDYHWRRSRFNRWDIVYGQGRKL
jgi:DNA polymerase-1